MAKATHPAPGGLAARVSFAESRPKNLAHFLGPIVLHWSVSRDCWKRKESFGS